MTTKRNESTNPLLGTDSESCLTHSSMLKEDYG
jgi:hypothetical protein